MVAVFIAMLFDVIIVESNNGVEDNTSETGGEKNEKGADDGKYW